MSTKNTNGTTANSNGQKPVTPATTGKPELSNVSVSANATLEKAEEQKQPVSLGQKFSQLQKLMEKREQIGDFLEDVTNFNISPTGGAHVQFRDNKGNTFAIAHPIVIGEMVSMSKNKLQEELNKIDSEICALFV